MASQQFTQLLIATRNAGKVREMTHLLRGIPVTLRTLSDFPSASEVEETGTTFAENATLKAQGYAAQTGIAALADDSGLEVVALDGRPGILSARYGGATATDEERCRQLLNELANVAPGSRQARFVCTIALAEPRRATARAFHGVCEGRVALHPQGSHGFGYDPIFIPEGYERTFGQLPDAVKQQISHRAKALAALCDHLGGLFGSLT